MNNELMTRVEFFEDECKAPDLCFHEIAKSLVNDLATALEQSKAREHASNNKAQNEERALEAVLKQIDEENPSVEFDEDCQSWGNAGDTGEHYSDVSCGRIGDVARKALQDHSDATTLDAKDKNLRGVLDKLNECDVCGRCNDCFRAIRDNAGVEDG